MSERAQDLFVMFWCGYTLFMVGIIVVAVIWAKKNKQFSQQAHAGWLPLEIEDDPIIKEQEDHE
jgi:nitrogen fixation-related uncharacterized protein